MTDVKYVDTFPCPTCKATASGRGHICHPNKDAVPFKCEFCGKNVDDARHVCTGMLDKLEYICGKCGRLAIYDSSLCEPRPVDSD